MAYRSAVSMLISQARPDDAGKVVDAVLKTSPKDPAAIAAVCDGLEHSRYATPVDTEASLLVLVAGLDAATLCAPEVQAGLYRFVFDAVHRLSSESNNSFSNDPSKLLAALESAESGGGGWIQDWTFVVNTGLPIWLHWHGIQPAEAVAWLRRSSLPTPLQDEWIRECKAK